MARPAVTHDGFLIPNANDVTLPLARMAEPDRIDFNTLGNDAFGVVSGCLVTVSGTTASTLGGIAVVAGVRVEVAAQTVTLSTGGALDRFDLVGCDAGGTLKIVGGQPATDPVMPDPPVSFTLFASVLAAAGTSNFADTVVDKRNLLPQALYSISTNATTPLIQSRAQGASPTFSIFGSGKMDWGNGQITLDSVAGTLTLTAAGLNVTGSVAAGSAGISSAGNVSATGFLQGSNLMLGFSLPGAATSGTIFAHLSSGKLYVRQGGAWQEIATVASAVPTGMVIDSLRPPSEMVALGWVPLDGRTVTESEYPTLFTFPTGGAVTGVTPNRSLTLPDLTDRVRRTSWGAPGTLGGSNTKSLTLENMPAHDHDVEVGLGGGGPITASIGQSGRHTHTTGGGEHSHPINDPGHQHNGMDFYGAGCPIIAVVWGGRNKIDALFNDRNHTYSVEALQWTAPAWTNISISSSGSDHTHLLSEHVGHSHPISVQDAPVHVHPVVEQSRGLGTPFDVRSAYVTVYTYVRA